jgi:acyl-CoA reductase-like NAD-dependent aldehyde dehydrogenase
MSWSTVGFRCGVKTLSTAEPSPWPIQTWQRAIPDLPTVLQNLNGYGATGGALIEAGLDKLAFTGSVATARRWPPSARRP